MEYNKNIWFDPNKPFMKPATSFESKHMVPPPVSKYNNNFKKWPAKSNEKKYTKFKYMAPDGKKLAAGGIILFEETTHGKGIWVVEEDTDTEQVIYTDFGGKYDHNDGDIFATISREFREETYNTAEITYEDIKNISKLNHVYIDDYYGKPVYLCIIVHMNQFSITFDSQKVRDEKIRIIEANPTVPSSWYRTKDVKFILLKDISSGKHVLSKRLHSILKNVSEYKNVYDPEIELFFKDLHLPRCI